MSEALDRLGKGRSAGAGAPGAYAVHSDETTAPDAAGVRAGGVGAGPQAQGQSSWLILGLAAAGLVGMLVYTQVWPAVQRALYQPSPVRDYLLAPSTRPVSVVAGVGVGWFWILFIATPLAVLALAALWWAGIGVGNRRLRTGHVGQLRVGQKWPGEQAPAGPLILAGAAAVLAGVGALLRWVGPVASSVPGLIVSVALLAVAGYGYSQYVQWAVAQVQIARQIAAITFLVSPRLAWRDLRSGRVRAIKRAYPRGGTPFPRVICLHYGQHSSSVDAEAIEGIGAVLTEVTGRHYVFDHDPLTRTLTATEAPPSGVDPVPASTAVLAPLVASWFDPGAKLSLVQVTDPDPQAGAVSSEPQDGGEVDSDQIAARVSEFTVEFVYNLKVSTPYRRGAIESAVADVLGGSWEATWRMPSRTVTFKRCPGLPTRVFPPLEIPAVTRATIRAQYKKASIPFGVDAYGNVLSWNFKDSPHMLICGPTATGKTSLLMTIAIQCAARGINLVFLDPKAFDSPGLRSWPNFSLVSEGTDDDGMVSHTAALRFIADTMRDRYSQVKINPNRANDFDPIVVIADEFANLVMELAKFYARFKNSKVDKGRPPTEEDVGTILRTARAVGIHMVLGLQRPDTMFIAGEARDNTALRVSMGRLRSKDAAIMMFNDPVAGTRVQPGIKGRGTVQMPDNSIREIQVFYTPTPPATDEQRAALSDEERSVLDALSAVDSFWPRRVVDSALRGYDPEDAEEPMSFSMIRDSPIVLAADRPDLDPTSEQYRPPLTGQRRPTMDDAHGADGEGEDVAGGALAIDGGQRAVVSEVGSGSFGSPIDGYADDYLPTIDDEYGPSMLVTADDLELGDLVDVAVDGVSDWKYVHADPYPCGDGDGDDRIVIPYRDLGDGQVMGDVDVELHAVMQVRKLNMN